MQHDVDRKLGTQNIFANITGRIGLVECSCHALLSQRHLAANVQEALRQSSRVTRDETTLNQLVRIALHQQAILVRAGLAFVSIDNQIFWKNLLWSKTPLCTCRKTRAAATKHGCTLHFFMHVGCCTTKRFTQTDITTCGQKAIESKRVGMLEA